MNKWFLSPLGAVSTSDIFLNLGQLLTLKTKEQRIVSSYWNLSPVSSESQTQNDVKIQEEGSSWDT